MGESTSPYFFHISLAHVVTRVTLDDRNWFRVFKKHWKPFIVPSEPSQTISITTTAKTLETRILSMSPQRLKLACHKDRLAHFTFGSLEYGIRKIIGRWLFDKRVYLIHASAIVNPKGEALLFTGPHESGKSTIVTLLRAFPCIADDCLFLRIRDHAIYCYTTPFNGKKNVTVTVPFEAPVKAVFFLQKRKKSRIVKLTTNRALQKTVQLFFMLYQKDTKLFNRILQAANSLRTIIPWYQLDFPNNASVQSFLKTSNFL